MIIEKTVRFEYPPTLLKRPLIHRLIRQFDLETNILEAHVSAEGGYLLVGVRGEAEQVEQGLSWMAEQGVAVIAAGTAEEA